MKINFTLTEDDIVAFSRHQYKNSRSITLTLRILYIALPVILFVISIFIFSNITGNMIMVLVSSTATSFLFLLIFWLLHKINITFIVPSIVKGMVNRDNEQAMIGRCILEIEDDTITEILNDKTISLKFQDLDRVEESESHIFIFISPTVALIVPKRDIDPGELSSFSATLYSRLH
jgi:hypothetical protein